MAIPFLNGFQFNQYRTQVEHNDGPIGKSLLRQILEIIKARCLGFTVEDYYVLGLYLGKNWDKMGSIRYHRVNHYLDPRIIGTIEFNKWIFSNYMKMMHIPVPETLGIFHPDIGIHGNLSDFRSRAQLYDFLAACNTRLVIKPINGAKGRGVIVINAINPETQAMVRANGQTITFDALYNILVSQNIAWLFQEKIIQRNDYAAFNPSSTNTVRLNTLITEKNEIIALSGLFRMGTMNLEVDNLSGGGLAALVDVSSGTLSPAMIAYSQKQYACHPNSGKPIAGYVLPMWDAIKQASIKAHKALPFARYLGWDIAVSENGPVFLEVNSFGAANFYEKYDTMNYMKLEIGKIYLQTVS